jgi:short-subunit dehydrogenase
MTESSFAVVTGASSGIGLELALLLAADGYDLVLCAEDDGLEAAAARCRAGGVEVQAFRTDLRRADGVQALYEAVLATGRPLDVAVLNAGVGRGGAFVDTDLADLLEVVDLNVTSTTHLFRLVLAEMVARDSGRVLVTSSIASTMPGAYQPVYNASKSFVQSLVEAVQNELKDTGVTITSLMPGPVETNFFHRADMDDTNMGQAKKDEPDDVAQQGYAALMAGRDRVVAASLMTKAQELGAKVLPDKVKAELHRHLAQHQDDPESTGTTAEKRSE